MYVHKKNQAFSLIEVLVFISVFAVFFVVAIAAVTASLRNMKINEHKIIATRYAEELQEWLKSEKEIDWNIFSTSRIGTYCFNNPIPISSWPAAGACGVNDFSGISGINPAIFKREMILTVTGNPVTQVDAVITVSWKEVNQTFNVTLNSVFNPWE